MTCTESDEILSLMSETSANVTKFPQDSFQSLLWNEQLKYNSLKENSQMRWHPLLIRFALSLKYASCSCIRTNKLLSFGFLALPLERTLHDYTHWCPTISGVQLHFIEQIKKALREVCVDAEKSNSVY